MFKPAKFASIQPSSNLQRRDKGQPGDRWHTYGYCSITIGLTATLSTFGLLQPLHLQAAEIRVVARSPWESWLDSFLKRKEPRDKGSGTVGGPRDGSCWLTPSLHWREKLWTTQPSLVWSGGTAKAVGVRVTNSQTVLWQQATPAIAATGVKRLRYAGQPLQPGQTYDLLFLADPSSSQPQSWQPFQIMTPAERAPITADLKVLDAQLQARKAKPETVALERAKYFAKRDLWVNALQEVYGVEKPSAELKQVTQQVTQTIQKQVCSPKSSP